jgi:hypothetical protein
LQNRDAVDPARHALVSLAVIVSLIAATRTEAGLRVRSELDRGRYPGGVSVSDQQMAQIALKPHRFHGAGTIRSSRPVVERMSQFVPDNS